MLRRPLLATLIAASLAAGCAVGPDYVRPETPLPGQYLGQPAIDARSATANADLLGTLRLLEAMRILRLDETRFYPRSPYGVAMLYAYHREL